MSSLYSEAVDVGAPHRERYLNQVLKLIETRQEDAATARRQFFAPDTASATTYAASLAPLRASFREMLGFPLVNSPAVPPRPQAQLEWIARDELGDIWRASIEAMPGYEIYGLLFLPATPGPHRLVLAQHGGMGTPELMAEFFCASNYNGLTRRLLRRGYAVFSPQLLLWDKEYGPEHQRATVEASLRQLGGSIAALELFGLTRALDYLLGREDILGEGAGMAGLSYGGFYTLFLAALDERIQAAVSSCFVNDRQRYNWADWAWRGASHQFLDGEVAGLVCPRALYIEVGDKDTLFDANAARPVLDEITTRYAAVGLAGHFEADIFDGGHEFATTDKSLDFLVRHLPPTAGSA